MEWLQMGFAALTSAVLTGVGAYFGFFRRVVTKSDCVETGELRSRPIMVKIDHLSQDLGLLRDEVKEVRGDIKWLVRHVDGGRVSDE